MAPLAFIICAPLLALVVAQSGTYIDCACSASARGYSRAARIEIRDDLRELNELRTELLLEQAQDPSITSAFIQQKLRQQAQEDFEGCTNNYSAEECVNADAALRYRAGNYRTSFCQYSRRTWASGGKPSCDRTPGLASTDPNIVAGRPEVASAKPTLVTPPPPTPKPKPSPPPRVAPTPPPKAAPAPPPKVAPTPPPKVAPTPPPKVAPTPPPKVAPTPPPKVAPTPPPKAAPTPPPKVAPVPLPKTPPPPPKKPAPPSDDKPKPLAPEPEEPAPPSNDKAKPEPDEDEKPSSSPVATMPPSPTPEKAKEGEKALPIPDRETQSPTPSGPSVGGLGLTETPGPGPSAPTSAPVCFPGSARVSIEGGGLKRMDELVVGDRVAVGRGMFAEIFMFTHKLANVEHEFVSLHTAAGPVLRLTQGHYLPLNSVYRPAGEAKVGDRVVLGDGTSTTIAEVSSVVDIGLFNPQTQHGDIVVDGVLASTYTTAVDPSMAHALLAPLRLMSEWARVHFTFLDSGANQVARFTTLFA